MTPGQKLIAKDPCNMNDDGRAVLTVGKEYPIVDIAHECYVINDEGHRHAFDDDELVEFFEAPAPSYGTWYPIESAPKDGTVFIGFEDDEVYKMKWVTGSPPVDSCFRLSDGNIHKIHIWGGEFEYKYPNPTHWTPLPELPKE